MAVTLTSPINTATPPYPREIAAADINGDGRTDLVVMTHGNSTNGHQEHAVVLLGNGQGSFQTSATFAVGSGPITTGSGQFQNFYAGWEVTGVALGDVNGDRHVDIIRSEAGFIPQGQQGRVVVSLGNGNGTFQAGQEFATSGSSEAVTVGDVNGDGKLDIVTANGRKYNGQTFENAGSISVLLGNGDGTFQGARQIVQGHQVMNVTLAHLNFDQHQDMVTTWWDSSGQGIDLWSGDGTGGFNLLLSIGANGIPGEAAVTFLGPAGVDFSPDILVATSAGLLVVKDIYNAPTYVTSSVISSLSVADLDGDGRADDVVVGGIFDTSYLIGNGNGTFQAAQSLGGPESVAVATAFINGDGWIDIVKVNLDADLSSSPQGSISVLLSDILAPELHSIVASTASTRAGTITETVTFSEAVTGVDAADFVVVTDNGTATGQIGPITGSGATYTVTINGITGTGGLRLDLKPTGTGIVDLAGRAITGNLPTGTLPNTVTQILSNATPVATAATLSTNEDTFLLGHLAGTDTDNDSLTFAIVPNSATNGLVVLTNPATGAFTFLPAANFSGTATFQFTASDGNSSGTSAAQTVTINVAPVEDVVTFNSPPPSGGLNVSNFATTLPGADTVQLGAGVYNTFGTTNVNVKVGGGATLGGTATLGDVLVLMAGMVRPGNSPGTLTMGDVSFEAGALFGAEIAGTGDGEYDRLNVTGTVTLGGATLEASVINGFDPETATGATFTLIDNDGTDAVDGTFANMAEGAVFAVDGHNFSITYRGGSGNNDVILTAFDDAPVVTAGSTVGYIEQQTSPAAVQVDPALTVADDGMLDGATVKISSGFVLGDELLFDHEFASAHNVTGSYFSGILAFTGTASAADYQTLLRSVTFRSQSDNPTNIGANTTRTVTWAVNDGTQDSAVAATTTINVTAVNDAPSVTDATLAAVAEDTTSLPGATVAVLFAEHFSDLDDNATINAVAISGNTANSQTEGVWQYTTDNGANWFDVGSVTDGAALVLDDSAKLRFVPASDFSGTPQSLSVYGIDQTYTGLVTNGGTRTTINASVNGGATPISDHTVSLSTRVTVVNDPPAAPESNNVTTDEDTASTAVAIGATDAENDALSYSVKAGFEPARGSVSFSNGSFVYTPTANVNGSDSFIILINDGNGGTTEQAVAVTINAINDAPVNAVPAGPLSVAEDTDLVISGLSVSDADFGSSEMTVTLTVQHGTLLVDETVSGGLNSSEIAGNGTGTVTLTGDPAVISTTLAFGGVLYRGVLNYNGPDTLTMTSNDGESSSAEDIDTVAINVTAVNDVPVASSPTTLVAIDEDSGSRLITQIELLANASDVDGPSLTAVNLSISAGLGSLAGNGDGTWTYTPAANDDTAVSFSYVIDDGVASPVAATASLDITPENDAPQSGAVVLAAIVEDSGARIITQDELLAEVIDPDGPPAVARDLAIVAGGPGSLVDNGDGTWTYMPAVNDDTAVSFSYVIDDGLASPVTASASLDITPVNDAPQSGAVALVAIAEDSGPRVIRQDALLSGVSDPDGPPAVARDLAIASGLGALVDNGDGTWTYTPGANDDAQVSFSYMIDDGVASPVTANASLDIRPVNDAPVLHNVPAGAVFANDPVILAPGLTITDIDSATLASATVRVSAGAFAAHGDVLAVGAAGLAGTSIVANYNATTETLTLSGTDTLAHYQQALEHVTFQTTNFGTDQAQTITWQLDDGAAANGLSALATTDIGLRRPQSNDFGGNGNGGILWQNTDGTPAIWTVDGTRLISGANVGFNPGPDWHTIGSGDFNGDGKSDILWQNKDGTIAEWFMDGTSLIAGGSVAFNPGPDWHAIGSGDFNGDGKSDILWQNADGTPAVWLMDGLNILSGANAGFNPGAAWHVIDSGDFNGDGKSDILWQNNSGQAAVWLMDGTSLVSGSDVGANPGPSWNVQAAGDFNGDGKADILWQNDNGQAAVWLMDGTSLIAGADVGFNPGAAWQVHDAADFNGDGKADILWQNADGTPAVWLMDGLSVVNGANVGFNPGANWHVVPPHHDVLV